MIFQLNWNNFQAVNPMKYVLYNIVLASTQSAGDYYQQSLIFLF